MDGINQNNSLSDSKIVKIDELIDYQKDSIVSRTLIDKKMGTITFFAFDQGQGLSEHTSPFDAIVQVLDGEVEVHILDKLFFLKSGNLIIMPANISHSVKAIKKFKMLLTMIKS